MPSRGSRAGRRAWVAPTLVALVAAGACSSTPEPQGSNPSGEQPTTVVEGSGETGGSTPAGTSVGTTPLAQDVAADEAMARSAVLTAGEVPGGPWTEGDRRDDVPRTGLDCQVMADDADFFDEHARDAPGVRAPELIDPATGATVQLDVFVVATDEIADRVESILGDARYPQCFEEQLRATGGGTLAITDLSVAPLDVDGSDAIGAWTVSFTAGEGDRTTDVRGALAVVRAGRAFATISMTADQPIDAATFGPVVDAAAEKLRASAGS